VTWKEQAAAVVAAASTEVVALAGTGPLEGALEVDAGSEWRASSMVGALLAGPAEVRGGTGEAAHVRIRPERVTWWQGWSSGTVSR
jgi:hypothetical protein